MLKIFLSGIVLGIVAAAGALYAVPAVDQHREISRVTVAANGGNREEFRISVPADRIMVGTAGQQSRLPAGMRWPQDDILAGVSSELFKLRNERDVVVGVAARTATKDTDAEAIDWVIHLPSRGTLFVNMLSAAQDGGHRVGRIRAGSREFRSLTGFVAERWIADASGEEDAPAGRIELIATYVGDGVESLE